MFSEQVYLERVRAPHPRPERVRRYEPDPLFGGADRVAAWSREFGAPATDREWTEALESGLIPFSP